MLPLLSHHPSPQHLTKVNLGQFKGRDEKTQPGSHFCLSTGGFSPWHEGALEYLHSRGERQHEDITLAAGGPRAVL